jgi:hypothetical protein
MKRDPLVDFFLVESHQLAIHARLNNWANYVRDRPSRFVSPIWKLGKSNGRQWHAPSYGTPIDSLDGHKLEKAVADLPEKHRDALRWSYCYPYILPHKVRKHLGVTDAGLMELVRSGRAMLVNRRV